MTFIKKHWLDMLAWACIGEGVIDAIAGVLIWNTGAIAMAAVSMFVGLWVLERNR